MVTDNVVRSMPLEVLVKGSRTGAPAGCGLGQRKLQRFMSIGMGGRRSEGIVMSVHQSWPDGETPCLGSTTLSVAPQYRLQRGRAPRSCLLSRDSGESTTVPNTAESAFNSELAKVLRRKHPRWLDRIGMEQMNRHNGCCPRAVGIWPFSGIQLRSNRSSVGIADPIARPSSE